MAATTDAVRARITAHMNRDHSHHLSLYLRHYNRLPSPLAADAKLIDLTLDTLTISCKGGTYQVPISPPMGDYAESRTRLKEMVYTSMEGLGMSPYRVERWIPGPIGALVAVGVVLGEWTTWNRKTQLVDGGWVKETLLLGNDTVAKILYDNAMLVFGLIIGIHVAETAWMLYSRLRKHEVKPFSLPWCGWVLSAFFEGAPSFVRFDREVERVKMEAEGKKGQ